MKRKTLNKILTISTLVSFVLMCISFCTVKKQQPKAVKSALLNPAYKDSLLAIIIQTPDEIITMRYENDVWSCEKQGIFTFTHKKSLEGFINNLTKIRTMYKISDTTESKIDLNLTEDSATIVTIIDSTGNAVSKLYFGYDDSLTSRISLRSEKSRICYETEDDLSPYLKTDINFWTEPEIFFSVKNPSNISLSKGDLYTLLSLRHGKVYESTRLPPDAVPEKSFILKGQMEAFQKVDFYSIMTPEGKEYLYIQHVEPEAIKNNAIYELSEWTYNRLTGLLKQ